MKDSIKILEVIDWYDGIVQALVSTNWLPNISLCSLLAFDVETKRRVFGLLPLAEEEVSKIKSLLNKDWDLLATYLKELWLKVSENVTLISCKDPENQIIAKTVVEANKLRGEKFLDIEDAVSEERMGWFEVFD
jgi:hypothetical protein